MMSIAHGLTAEEAAKAVGVSRASLDRWAKRPEETARSAPGGCSRLRMHSTAVGRVRGRGVALGVLAMLGGGRTVAVTGAERAADRPRRGTYGTTDDAADRAGRTVARGCAFLGASNRALGQDSRGRGSEKAERENGLLDNHKIPPVMR